MKALLRKLRSRLLAGFARQADLDRLYAQIAGLLQIQNAMQGHPVLRPLRGWAMSPDAMALVLADLQERNAPTVVEFGSGQSTVILAAALRHRGGRLLSVEHEPDYSAVIRRQVTACGLIESVQFIHAPLCNSKEKPPICSYDTSCFPDILVDVALVDGPPLANGIFTRLTPLRWAAGHLRSGGAVFLDDSLRAGERACLTQLGVEYPDLRVSSHDAEKGLVRLRAVEA